MKLRTTANRTKIAFSVNRPLHYRYRCTTVIQFKLVKSAGRGHRKIIFRAYFFNNTVVAEFLQLPPSNIVMHLVLLQMQRTRPFNFENFIKQKVLAKTF